MKLFKLGLSPKLKKIHLIKNPEENKVEAKDQK